MSKEELMGLEQALSTLLGWTDIKVGNFYGDTSRFTGKHPEANSDSHYIPQWARRNDAAFSLMVEHGILIRVDKTYNEVITQYGADDTQDYSSEEEATRVAIVKAVIRKLKGDKQ